MTINSRYIFVASMDVDPDKEALFNEVYDSEHIPILLKVPGVRAVTRMAGEHFADVGVPRAGQRVRQYRQDEHKSEQCCDRTGGAPQDGAECETEQADEHEIRRRAKYRSQDVWIGDRHAEMFVSEDGLTHPERREARHDGDHEGHSCEHDALGGEYDASLRH